MNGKTGTTTGLALLLAAGMAWAGGEGNRGLLRIVAMKLGHIMAAFAALGMLLATGCGYSKDINEYPEPWQTLDPGKPLEKFPKIEILEQGEGAGIEPGDLVQLRIKGIRLPEGGQRERGEWWFWIGFVDSKQTAFFSITPKIASALVGVKQGSSFRFVDVPTEIPGNPNVVGRLWPTPFGSSEYYSWRKNIQDNAYVYGTTDTGYTFIEIKRVCKGLLQYRTVRLFDDSPVEVCSGLKCYTSNKPSEAWVDEAHLEATCSDGKVAIFQYGPIDSRSGRAGRSPVMGYFDDWLYQSWKKLPLGVQFKGNRSPVVTVTNQQLLATRSDTPLQIDLSGWIRDPDGDRLTVRFLGQPVKGSLTPNPDGTMFTYTPKPGASGSELLSYKVSDGLVESENVGRILINVWKPAE